MQLQPSRADVPACLSLIRAFFQQHAGALCNALDSVGAAEIAQLLRLCSAVQLSREPAVSAAGGDEESPQVLFIRQRCWLELHHGVYRHVAVVWRDVYLSTSLLLAAQAAAHVPAREPALLRALKAIDSALLFGAVLGRSVAEDVYEQLSELVAHITSPDAPAKRRKTMEGEGDASPPPSVLNVRLSEEELPQLTQPMPRVPPPSLLQFRTAYLLPLLPAVFESLAEHWPATMRWRDLGYLEAAAGTRSVPVELGDHYLAHNWRQQLMPVAQFIKEHMVASAAAGRDASAPVMGYVAQHDLFSQVKKLRGDIVVPDYVCASAHGDATAGRCPAAAAPFLAGVGVNSPYRMYHCCSTACCSNSGVEESSAAAAPAAIKRKVPRECVSPTPPSAGGDDDDDECCVRMHAWFGPAGTVSPLHHDPSHNVLVQVQGYKYVRLYAPCQSHRLYPFPSGLTTNSSQVDVADVDDTKFPLFRGAPYLEAVLKPGDALFIPIFHWHYVRSLTPSFSVSFWWK